MDVFSISDLFIDSKKVEQRGVLICFNYKCPEARFDGLVFMVPIVKNGDEEKKLIFNSNEVCKVMFYEESQMIGFVCQTKQTKNMMILISLDNRNQPQSIKNAYPNEMKVFFRRCHQFLPLTPVVKVMDDDDARNFLTDSNNNLDRGQDIFETVFLNQTSAVPTVLEMIDVQWRPYLRSYVYFMLEHQNSDEDECKAFIKSVENVPKFVKSLSWTKPETMMLAMGMMMMTHACRLPECNSYSLDKCGGCVLASYCDENCQGKDWEAHRKVCNAMRIQKQKEYYVATLVESQLQMYLGKRPSLNFEMFFKALGSKIYDSCHAGMYDRQKFPVLEKQFKEAYGVNFPRAAAVTNEMEVKM